MGIEEAVALHETLRFDRDDPSHWSQNIIDASELLVTKRDWTLFYAYLAEGKDFDREKQYVTMEDVKLQERPELHQDLEEIYYKNGTETTIHVRRKRTLDDDDEKKAI